MARYLLSTTPAKERAIQQRVQTRVANHVRGEFQSEILKAFEAAATEYQEWGSDAVINSVLPAHNRAMQETVSRTWQRTADLAGERILNAAKEAHGAWYWERKDNRDIFNSIVQGYILTEALSRSVGLGLTTIAAIRGVIARGKERGESVDEIAGRIRAQGLIDSQYRSMMIARTESHGAYNVGRQAAAEASALDLSKEWVSANDSRTRDDDFDHVAADGEVVSLNEMFTGTGESMRFPGDPNGSAGNVIHCRCATIDVLN